MQNRYALLGILLVVAGVAMVLAIGAGRRHDDRAATLAPGSPERAFAPGSRVAPTAPGGAAPPSRFVDASADVLRRARGPRPRSLSGTEVDGGLSVGEDGHFRPDADALALFDYFLAASGEEPPAVIRQRILDAIAQRLAPPADAEAVAFLDRYLDYREAVRELAEGGAVPPELARRLQWLRELRRAHFGVDSEALFGSDETMTRIDLERRRVFMDATLSDAERAEQLAGLEEQLPESVREARRRASAPARVRDDVRRLRAAGADPSKVFAVREAAFGTEAAQRLAALDEERAAWDARVEAYRLDREALLAELGGDALGPEHSLAESDQARLEALRRAHFEEEELLRVRVMDAAR